MRIVVVLYLSPYVRPRTANCSLTDPKVAAVVAETMHGYPLGGKILVAHTVDVDKLHESTFEGAENGKFRQIPWRTIARQQQVRYAQAFLIPSFSGSMKSYFLLYRKLPR